MYPKRFMELGGIFDALFLWSKFCLLFLSLWMMHGFYPQFDAWFLWPRMKIQQKWRSENHLHAKYIIRSPILYAFEICLVEPYCKKKLWKSLNHCSKKKNHHHRLKLLTLPVLSESKFSNNHRRVFPHFQNCFS